MPTTYALIDPEFGEFVLFRDPRRKARLSAYD
jgi:hypothetical protein